MQNFQPVRVWTVNFTLSFSDRASEISTCKSKSTGHDECSFSDGNDISGMSSISPGVFIALPEASIFLPGVYYFIRDVYCFTRDIYNWSSVYHWTRGVYHGTSGCLSLNQVCLINEPGVSMVEPGVSVILINFTCRCESPERSTTEVEPAAPTLTSSIFSGSERPTAFYILTEEHCNHFVGNHWMEQDRNLQHIMKGGRSPVNHCPRRVSCWTSFLG